MVCLPSIASSIEPISFIRIAVADVFALRMLGTFPWCFRMPMSCMMSGVLQNVSAALFFSIQPVSMSMLIFFASRIMRASSFSSVVRMFAVLIAVLIASAMFFSSMTATAASL